MIKSILKNIRSIWRTPVEITVVQGQLEMAARIVDRLDDRVRELQNRLGETTFVHVDVGYKLDPTQVIVVGRYKERDYVRVFNLPADRLEGLVDQLNQIERGSRVGRVDMMPHAIPFRALCDRDRFE